MCLNLNKFVSLNFIWSQNGTRLKLHLPNVVIVQMVTVEEAVSLWEPVDKKITPAEQARIFRDKLLEHIASSSAPDTPVPKKSSRLRSKILNAIAGLQRRRGRSDNNTSSLWFIKPTSEKRFVNSLY